MKTLKHYKEDATFWSDLWPEQKYSEYGLLWKYDIPSNGGLDVYNYLKDQINYRYIRDMITASNSIQFEEIWLSYIDICYSNIKGNENGILKREKEIEKC